MNAKGLGDDGTQNEQRLSRSYSEVCFIKMKEIEEEEKGTGKGKSSE